MEKRPVGLTILAIFNLYQAVSALLVTLTAFCISVMVGDSGQYRAIIMFLLMVPSLALQIISGIGILKMRYRSGFICGIAYGVFGLFVALISIFLNGWNGIVQSFILIIYPLSLLLFLRFRYRKYFIAADGVSDKNTSLFLNSGHPLPVDVTGIISDSLSGITKVKLHFDQKSLQIEDDGNNIEFMDWSSVLEVFAFKSDVFAYDLICIGFRIDQEGDYFEVNEEAGGYADLVRYLPEIFPDIKRDWFSEVAFPAFKTNLTTLWGCPEIKNIWEPKEERSEITCHVDPPEEKSQFNLPGKIGGIVGMIPIIIIVIIWVTGNFESIFVGYVMAFALMGSLTIGLPMVLANIVDTNFSKPAKVLISLFAIVLYILPVLFMVFWFIGMVGVSFTS